MSTERINQHLDFLIDPIFQAVNRLSVLPFENKAQQTSYKQYYLSARKIKNYNVMIDGQNFFDQPIRNNLIKYDNDRKIATDQRDDYTTDCLRDYNYFKNYYKMIAIDLSKQQAFNADPKTMEQINFAANLQQQATIFFIVEEATETISDFSQGTVKVL